jgi:hypothetical protein
MKRLRNMITAAGLALMVLSPIVVVAAPATTYAVSSAEDCYQRFLTFPVWYRGLAEVDAAGNCGIKSPAAAPGGIGGFIWRIVLNAIEIGLHAVGYLAIAFIIMGGFMYMTAGGDAKLIEKGKKTLTNAIIGLVMSIASIAIVNLIFSVVP